MHVSDHKAWAMTTRCLCAEGEATDCRTLGSMHSRLQNRASHSTGTNSLAALSVHFSLMTPLSPFLCASSAKHSSSASPSFRSMLRGTPTESYSKKQTPETQAGLRDPLMPTAFLIVQRRQASYPLIRTDLSCCATQAGLIPSHADRPFLLCNAGRPHTLSCRQTFLVVQRRRPQRPSHADSPSHCATQEASYPLILTDLSCCAMQAGQSG